MYRQAVRSAPRASSALRQSCLRSAGGRRFASTAPSDKPRTWRSSVVRWGLAAAAVYYYNTSPIFADEPQSPRTVPAPPQFAESDLKTVDSVIEEKRQKAALRAKETQPSPAETSDNAPTVAAETSELPQLGSPEALEEEADQQGAFNPETGEINWDCACLGGMAHGPCGEEFKAAFSCFVYSEEEPKGIECIDKFQGMQECFKKYPEIYDAELAGEDGDAEGEPAVNTDGDAEPSAASSSRTEEATIADATATLDAEPQADQPEPSQVQNTIEKDPASDATDAEVKSE
ncbi:hypothetical protein ACRALDRAFT_1066074 [Sodiomyces alcalophilus JCM 7366]|uniref:uncharacterized protein n=1 Tax=Sodiomyces alcalophilus JCM 7366 TaxID=591952 RepID=UPI0039B60679